MNYGKRGIRAQQKALNSTGGKWGKKFLLTFFNLTLIAIVGVGIIAASAGFGVFKGIIDTSPDITNINVTPTGFSTFAYDKEGNEIGKLVSTNANRIPVGKDMIPQDLSDAFVAIEDARFYEHNGIDIKGIIRAAYVGISNGDFSEGASTITQQLLKNNVFTSWTSEDTFLESAKRKLQEQYLALELEKIMSKEDILLNYMNSINLGQNTLGVQAASLRYFNKSVKDLTLSECAVIASVTQNPSRLNPISHPEDNDVRRKRVLRYMLEQGYIDQAEHDEAVADDVYSRIQIVNEETGEESTNSYFVDALIEEVMADLLAAGYSETVAFNMLYSGGLKIHTTLDPSIQAICDEVFANEENYPEDTKWYLEYKLTLQKSNGDIENHSSEMFKTYFTEFERSFNMIFSSQEEIDTYIANYKDAVMESGDEVLGESISVTPQPQVSITVADQSTGHVVAMVGGRGVKEGSRTLNRAVSTERQPGSCFKVVAVYAPALDSAGLTLATVQNDAPFNYADGRPVSNWYSTGYRGLTSLRVGIEQSMNIVAVKTLTQITPQLGFDYLQNFGFSTLVERQEVVVGGETEIHSDIVQPLALGGVTWGVTNLELNASYATIANGGTYIKPKLYTRILNHDGSVLLDNTDPESRQVIKETTAFLLTDAMEDVVTMGTGASVNFGNMAIAGKTGTTTKDVDVWFAGYTPYYTATTWAGYDNNVTLRTDAEKRLARNLWRAVMSQIHEELPSASFQVPPGIVQQTVCSRSGKLPIPGLCDGTLRIEYFAEGTVPTEQCNAHYQGMICQYSNLPACEGCPFKVHGVLETNPPEDPSLLSGSGTVDQNVGEGFITTQITNEDGTQSTVNIPQANTVLCPHNLEFFALPEAEAVIEQQRAEIAAAQQQLAAEQAAQAAQAAQEAQAAQAAQTQTEAQGEPVPPAEGG